MKQSTKLHLNTQKSTFSPNISAPQKQLNTLNSQYSQAPSGISSPGLALKSNNYLSVPTINTNLNPLNQINHLNLQLNTTQRNNSSNMKLISSSTTLNMQNIQNQASVSQFRVSSHSQQPRQIKKISPNSPQVKKLSIPKYIEQPYIPQDQLINPENLNKKLNEMKDEYKKKIALLEQLKSEYSQSHQQKEYLEKAEITTIDIHNKFNNTTSVISPIHQTQVGFGNTNNKNNTLSQSNIYNSQFSPLSQTSTSPHNRKQSFNHFRLKPTNPIRNFMPFMSLRVQTNGYDVQELNQKMSQLITKMNEMNNLAEREDLDNESLKYMKQDMLLQKQCDHIKLKQLMPNVEDMEQILGNLELAKIVNQTRVNTAMSGIHKCKGDMSFFKVNKQDRLYEKRLELQDQEAEKKLIKDQMDQKKQQLEASKKKLQVLKKQNDSIKIDDIIVKFFEKRNSEEDLLNKLDMIFELQVFMNDRKQSNDFAFESDIKSVQSYLSLMKVLYQETEFVEKLQQSKANQITLKLGQTLMSFKNHDYKDSVNSHNTSHAISSAMLHRNPHKEKERVAQQQTLSIQVRWENIRHRLYIKEKFIVNQYEEVMIKNQLLNVSFDEWCAEKNKRKILLESLESELLMYHHQIRTSQKLMSEENSNPESITNLKFLYENYKKNHMITQKILLAQNFKQKMSQYLSDLMIKITMRIDKIKTVVPEQSLKQIQKIVNIYIGNIDTDSFTPVSNNQTNTIKNGRNSRRQSRRQSLLKPGIIGAQYDEQTFQKLAESSSLQNLAPLPHKQNTIGSHSPYRSSITPRNYQKSSFRKGNLSRKNTINKKRQQDESPQSEENQLYSRLQKGIKYQLNSMMNMNNLKGIIQGLKELTKEIMQVYSQNQQNQEIQSQKTSEQELYLRIDFNEQEEHKFVKRDISFKQFKEEYKTTLGIFKLKPKNVNEPVKMLSQKQSQSDLNQIDMLYESRPQKSKKPVIDENLVENSFVQNQYKKLKEQKIKRLKEMEQAKLKQEQAKLRQIMIENQTPLQNSYLLKSSHSVQSVQSQKLKGINKKLVDFQMSESRFINKFVKECDNVSLKINRFTAAVMPAQEPINLSSLQNPKQSVADKQVDVQIFQVNNTKAKTFSRIEKRYRIENLRFQKQSGTFKKTLELNQKISFFFKQRQRSFLEGEEKQQLCYGSRYRRQPTQIQYILQIKT
eukprot:403333819